MKRKRGSDSYKRKSQGLKPRQNVLIVCEGEKTEMIYFKYLKRNKRIHSLTISDSKGKSAPIHIINRAIKTSSKDLYDKIWCVFDVDIPVNPNLNKAIQLAMQHKIKIALSNPCFEFWYLLHFGYTCSGMNNCRECVKKLKRKFPKYNKSEDNIIKDIIDNTNDAIQNAKDVINNHCSGSKVCICNPSTEVHTLVEYLLSFKIN